ncbi:uncharacterized protein BP5553_06875 [Venustampulla echinocandica]|uniref:Uncharacterized protein n=1 Tax=Venustampulla echinocandica TaxID=2656787 RepID=A0A370TL66_9HELO|nr:uncharacterized protein BP5553_06875 [Venustampulla echinocandica]RDL36263.1 hypothetical protein BP5553_06875 [Venustampulla echinocandica]
MLEVSLEKIGSVKDTSNIIMSTIFIMMIHVGLDLGIVKLSRAGMDDYRELIKDTKSGNTMGACLFQMSIPPPTRGVGVPQI